ncbi:RNA-binding cell elongation regulator Jag/EloR [Thermodesulfobacteriota bacterium]
MMETYSFEGKTTDEAIENARKELNLSIDEMDIEIIEPESTGIFGIVGGRKAKIKVSVGKEDIEITDRDGLDGLSIAKGALESILSLIPMSEAIVKGEKSDGTINLYIEGDKSGLLIGRKGRTLDALQFIVNKIVNKALEKRTPVVVDSEGYRKRRRDFLVQMALKMSDKAKKINKPVATNLLNSHDRRIVHLTLRDDKNLETKSRGEGLLKKVIIFPKR